MKTNPNFEIDREVKIMKQPLISQLETRTVSNASNGSGSAIFPERVWKAIARSLKLSGRELEIVRGTFDGRTEPAIGADLGISTHTVHTHIERLHRKLLVPDRVQLVLRITNEFLRLTTQASSRLPPLCAHRAAGCCPLRPSSRPRR